MTIKAVNLLALDALIDGAFVGRSFDDISNDEIFDAIRNSNCESLSVFLEWRQSIHSDTLLVLTDYLDPPLQSVERFVNRLAKSTPVIMTEEKFLYQHCKMMENISKRDLINVLTQIDSVIISRYLYSVLVGALKMARQRIIEFLMNNQSYKRMILEELHCHIVEFCTDSGSVTFLKFILNLLPCPGNNEYYQMCKQSVQRGHVNLVRYLLSDKLPLYETMHRDAFEALIQIAIRNCHTGVLCILISSYDKTTPGLMSHRVWDELVLYGDFDVVKFYTDDSSLDDASKVRILSTLIEHRKVGLLQCLTRDSANSTQWSIRLIPKETLDSLLFRCSDRQIVSLITDSWMGND